MKVRLFSCGSDAGDWVDRNCEYCWKGSRLKADGDYTKSHCAIQNDIINAWMGDGLGKKSTYECVKQDSCPKKEEKRPQRKKTDKNKDVPTLF